MMRLGSQYRLNCFRTYGVRFEGERVLDVGCHDGDLLISLESGLRVGVDIALLSLRDSVLVVQADGRRLPFRSGSFDQTIALDVIEHVPDGAQIIHEMVRVTFCGGRLFVTTPSASIRMFPPFLTGWISSKWGHCWRRGYTESELWELVGNRCSCSVLQWNAPAYRFWYLPLRLLSVVWPASARHFVGWVARWDARHRRGHRGFYWMWCEKEDTQG
jgi:ubiquinone/menaquinone biosynthesis C-methylase UbiE